MPICDIQTLIKTSSIPNAVTPRLLVLPLANGTIESVRVKLEGANTSDDVVFGFSANGVALFTTELTIASGANEIDAATSTATTNDQFGVLSIESPFTSGALSGVTAIGLQISYVTQTVNLTGTQTIAGAKTFSSDVIVPDEAYDATAWNGSLEVPTKNAIRDKIETMGGGGLAQYTAADATQPGSLYFSEDTDNGTNKITITAPASIASDKTITLPDATGTLALTSDITTAINNVVNAAPGALDTLDELAAALGDDANFASTVTTALAGKQATLVSGTNIKTVNGNSLLGSGDLFISGGTVGSGTFNIDDGTAVAAGTFIFDDGTAA